MIWDLGLITKSNPHFLDYETRFEMILNRDSSFDLFLSITQIKLIHYKFIISPNMTTMNNHKYFNQFN